MPPGPPEPHAGTTQSPTGSAVSAAARPLRVAVVGCGAFGRNHLRVYRELETAHPERVQLAALVEPDPTRRADLAALYNIPAFATVPDLLATFTSCHPARSEGPASNPGAPCPASGTWVDAASLCVPTLHHASVAEQLLLANIDILIEKPFAATLAEADHLIALARERARILAVGHLERFNPAVTATLAALNRPMFFEAHRLSIFTPRSLDVDVVLDLMIHDLDIVLALTNSPVREVRAVGLPILSRKTDIANVRVEFDSGCVANFTASRVSTEQVRKLRLFQPHQYLSLDFARQELLSIDVDPAILAILQRPSPQPPSQPTSLPAHTLSSRPEAERSGDAVERPAAPTAALPGAPFMGSLTAHGWGAGVNPDTNLSSATTPPHPTPGFTLSKPSIPHAEPLRLELEDFLHAVRNRTQPRVPAEAGRAALSLALEINARIAAHAHRAGLASDG